MSVATNGIDCLCPPKRSAFVGPDGRPLPKIFSEHRIEVFQAIARHLPFAHWQSLQPDDIGLMVSEWLVYLLDNLSFYNDKWMREQHIETAELESSLRQIAALTGYQPRPNLAATARLAVLTDTAAPFVVPPGKVITSEGSENIPALSFETVGAAAVLPALSQMTAIPPREDTFDRDFLAVGSAMRNLRVDEPLLFQKAGMIRAVLVTEIASDKFPSGEPYAELVIDEERSESLAGLDGEPLDSIHLRSFVNQSEARAADASTLKLPGVHPDFYPGQVVVLIHSSSGEMQRASIEGVTTQNETLVTSASNPVISAFTRIAISDDATLTADNPYRIYHRTARAGNLVGAPMTHMTLADFGGSMAMQEKYLGATLDYSGDFVVMDADDRAVPIKASLEVNPNSRRASLNLLQVEDAAMELRAPLRVHGNFLEVDQGKTIIETLGSTSGRRYQQFRLGQKPLTFLRQPDAEPAPALEVFVDNVPWRYAPHLYGVGDDERVFVLKVEADGQAHVILAGVTSPGQKNVVARYRFGTTGDNPLAMKINKPAARIEGVAKLFNPNRAVGGLVGDTAGDFRFILPARISANDRCVSGRDYEVLSENFGALSAKARPYWSPESKQTGVEVIVVYDGGLDEALTDKLRSHLENHAPEGSLVAVVGATPYPGEIRLSLRVTPGGDPDDVRRRVLDVYFHRFTGLLGPRRIRIGHAYNRAEILAPLSGIKGIGMVESLSLDGSETRAALTLAPCEYLDADMYLEVKR